MGAVRGAETLRRRAEVRRETQLFILTAVMALALTRVRRATPIVAA
jgi:hypothetical protein